MLNRRQSILGMFSTFIGGLFIGGAKIEPTYGSANTKIRRYQTTVNNVSKISFVKNIVLNEHGITIELANAVFVDGRYVRTEEIE